MMEELGRFLTYYNVVFLLKAALATLALTALGCIVGFVLGFAIAVLRRTRSWLALPFRVTAIALVQLFRRTPFLVTLMLVFFGFQMIGANVDVFFVAAFSVCFIATAFISEIIGAGLDSVHANQYDTATTMNFNMLETLRHVIIPQAWPIILPPAFSFFLLFVKDSALASQIGVVELTYAGKVMNNKGFSPTLSFGSILVLYFLISYPLAKFGQYMEARLAQPRNKRR